MNDLSNALEMTYTVIYADDTNIFIHVSGNNIKEMTEKPSYELNQQSICFKSNRLSGY